MPQAMNNPAVKDLKEKDKTSPRGMAPNMSYASNSTMKSKQSTEREETFDPSSRNAAANNKTHQLK